MNLLLFETQNPFESLKKVYLKVSQFKTTTKLIQTFSLNSRTYICWFTKNTLYLNEFFVHTFEEKKNLSEIISFYVKTHFDYKLMLKENRLLKRKGFDYYFQSLLVLVHQ